MNTRTSLATLRQQLESLFPGKWVQADHKQKTLLTGLAEIDQSLTRGIARQRITEWLGSVSSGKTSVLRNIISHWCASGFDVAYIDTEDRLVASDWVFIEQRVLANKNSQQHSMQSAAGRFWVIRNLPVSTDTAVNINKRAKPRLPVQNPLWATDELIRSHAFDVVILDMGQSERAKPIPSRVYARLQNSLSKSKTALILLRDSEFSNPGWGCYAQIGFRFQPTVKSIDGLHGAVMILPSINCSVVKDGLSQTAEVEISSHVANRLFTHPHVPDRRTPKA
jgi:hypothetical protein